MAPVLEADLSTSQGESPTDESGANPDEPEDIDQPNGENRNDPLGTINPDTDKDQANMGSPTLDFDDGPKPSSQPKIAESKERLGLAICQTPVLSLLQAQTMAKMDIMGAHYLANEAKEAEQVMRLEIQVIKESQTH